MNSMVQKFLEQRALIDSAAAAVPVEMKKEKTISLDKMRPEIESVRDIIAAKPSKKVVMDFLKRKVAQYTDESSDSDC
jgi:hypothetical protein